MGSDTMEGTTHLMAAALSSLARLRAGALLCCCLSLALAMADPPPSFFNCSEQGPDAFRPVLLKNSKGMSGTMIAYGDVLLGWDDLSQYCSNPQHTYFGATICRIANRIKKCRFDFHNQTYKTSCNEKGDDKGQNGFDTLHGGVLGFDRRVWAAVAQTDASVTWSYHSPDGEMGFPGDLWINVTHTITEDNEWTIEYSGATSTSTVVAMTNHAYFNLNANVENTPTVMEHILQVHHGDTLQDVTGPPGYHLIPTGTVSPVKPGSVWDFSRPKALGKDIDRGDVTAHGGYDNAWIFSDWSPGMEPRPVVSISSALTGIQLAMSTDQPSVQIYSGNFLNGTDAALRIQRKASQSFGATPQYYQYRGAFTLEAQQYLGAVNYPNFPSVEITAGKRYVQRTGYRFTVAK